MRNRCIVVLSTACLVVACLSSAPTHAASRFDEMDPEIRKAAEIDFSTVDLSTVDQRTRVLSGMALSEFLTVARNKAEHRADLALAYIAQENLGEEYAKWQSPDAPVEPMAYADGQKLAVAYMRTEAGQNAMAGKLTSDDPEMLGRLVSTYDKMNGKLWTEAVALRTQADRAARFLDSKGKFDAFMTWAYAESKKAEAAHAEEMNERQIEYAKRMEEERAQRQQVAQANAQRRHEEKMKQLELAYQYKTEKLKAQAEVAKSYNERYQPYNDWGWDGDYYRNRYTRTYYRR